MTDEKKTNNKLTKVVNLKTAKHDTYIQCLEAHIAQLTDEQKNAEPLSMFIGSITETGCAYSILTGEDIAQLVGAIDIIKQYIFFDMLSGE